MTANARLALIGVVLLGIVLGGPYLHRGVGDLAFITLLLTHGALALRATRLAMASPGRRTLLLIGGVAVALRLGLLFGAPTLSTDAYRYVWDGRVQNAGINPYRYIPEAPELEALRDDAISPNINRADYAVTIYPPAAQILFALVGAIADGLVAMKLALLACEAITVAILLAFLRRLGQPATRIVAYAWHPLAVWEIAGSGHVDAAMVAAVMAGLWLSLVAGRRVAAAATLAVATLVKPFAVLVLAAAWRPWEWRPPAVAIAVAVALYLPYLSVGWGVLGFLPTYLGEEKLDTGEGFWAVAAVEWLVGAHSWLQPAYLAFGAGVLGWLTLRLAFAADRSLAVMLRRVFALLLAALWFVSPNWPWYYLILVPLVTLGSTPVGWAATLACFVLYDEIWGDRTVPFLLRDTLFNLTVLGALLWQARIAPRTEMAQA